MWEYHTRLCALFLFLAIPIAIADFVLFERQGWGVDIA